MNREEGLIWMVQNPGKELLGSNVRRYHYSGGRFLIETSMPETFIAVDVFPDSFTTIRRKVTPVEACRAMLDGKTVWYGDSRWKHDARCGFMYDAGHGFIDGSLSLIGDGIWYLDPPEGETK